MFFASQVVTKPEDICFNATWRGNICCLNIEGVLYLNVDEAFGIIQNGTTLENEKSRGYGTVEVGWQPNQLSESGPCGLIARMQMSWFDHRTSCFCLWVFCLSLPCVLSLRRWKPLDTFALDFTDSPSFLIYALDWKIKTASWGEYILQHPRRLHFGLSVTRITSQHAISLTRSQPPHEATWHLCLWIFCKSSIKKEFSYISIDLHPQKTSSCLISVAAMSSL